MIDQPTTTPNHVSFLVIHNPNKFSFNSLSLSITTNSLIYLSLSLCFCLLSKRPILVKTTIFFSVPSLIFRRSTLGQTATIFVLPAHPSPKNPMGFHYLQHFLIFRTTASSFIHVQN